MPHSLIGIEGIDQFVDQLKDDLVYGGPTTLLKTETQLVEPEPLDTEATDG